jgi:hypothetical protein
VAAVPAASSRQKLASEAETRGRHMMLQLRQRRSSLRE